MGNAGPDTIVKLVTFELVGAEIVKNVFTVPVYGLPI